MNEVEIVVVGKDKTDSTFNTVRAKALKAGTDAGTSFATSLGKEAMAGVSKVVGPAGAVLAGIGIASAPLIGASISAAVIGGASLGGIVGGIMLVKDDPRIKSAAADVGKTITSQLKVAAEPIVGPVLQGLHIIEDGFNDSAKDFGRIFQNASQFIEPLARSASSALQSITGGIADLTDNSAGVMGALADGVEMIGDTIGKGFSALSENGASAATAVSGAFAVVNETLKITFFTVDKLSEAFGLLAKSGALGPGASASYERWDQTLKQAKESTDDLTTANQTASASITELSDTMAAQADPVLGYIDATNAAATAADAFNTAVARYGPNSEQAADAALKLTRANVRQADAASKAAGAMDDSTIPSLIATARAAGRSESQIRAMVSTLTRGQHALEDYEGTYTATVITVYKSFGSKPNTAIGGIGNSYFKGYASGGVVGGAATGGPRSNMVMVGEQGPELVDLPVGSMVHNNSQTQAMISGGSDGGQLDVTMNLNGDLNQLWARDFMRAQQAGLITFQAKLVK